MRWRPRAYKSGCRWWRGFSRRSVLIPAGRPPANHRRTMETPEGPSLDLFEPSVLQNQRRADAEVPVEDIRISRQELESRFDKCDVVLFDAQFRLDLFRAHLCEFASIPMWGDASHFQHYISTSHCGEESSVERGAWYLAPECFQDTPTPAWVDAKHSTKGKVVVVQDLEKALFLRRLLTDARHVFTVVDPARTTKKKKKNAAKTFGRTPYHTTFGRCPYHREHLRTKCSSHTVLRMRESLTGRDEGPFLFDRPPTFGDVLEDYGVGARSDYDVPREDVKMFELSDIILVDVDTSGGGCSQSWELAALSLEGGWTYRHFSARTVGPSVETLSGFGGISKMCPDAWKAVKKMARQKVVLVQGAEKAGLVRQILTEASRVFSVCDLPPLPSSYAKKKCPHHVNGGDSCSTNAVFWMRDVLPEKWEYSGGDDEFYAAISADVDECLNRLFDEDVGV